MKNSTILKIAIFATGFAGIVAEYILSTLATYFIGNSIIQWTMIVSLMLFFMGVGSRVSRLISKNLITKFLILEIVLSLTVSFSSITVYIIASFTIYYAIAIYSLCILIGFLIGLEIPIVMRINEEYEELKTNISSVLEKDYYGSLLGGIFFAFLGLPYLGLTYTPFILGIVNLSIAIMVTYMLFQKIEKINRNRILGVLILASTFIIGGIFLTKPIIQWGEQKKYKDKVIFSKQTPYQKIVLTEWKDDYWLYLNGNLQLCSIDEVMYHEPLIHPALNLVKNPTNVLILGGGDGCAVRELLKYPSIKHIELVDLDSEMTNLGKSNEILLDLNQNALNNPKVKIHNEDAYNFLEKQNHNQFYDAIIIDLPDPRNIELGRLYSYEFYNICYRKLRPNGVLITQAGSPYYATKAFNCIEKTMSSAQFKVIPMHNQVLSLGEWGWMLGVKNDKITTEQLKHKLKNLKFDSIPTQWLNEESMSLITSFGKSGIFKQSNDSIEINRIHNPVLYQYYLKGNWDIY